MREPGDLHALGESGLAAWNAVVERCFRSALDRPGTNPHLLRSPDGRTPETTGPDWNGFPARVAGCLTRRQAWELLDWQGESGDEGRRRLQEEYVEWRVVHDASGAVQRVELTTELADYWKVLAAHQPESTLALIAEFARRPSVPAGAVYGSCDPFAAGVSPEDRAAAFTRTMVDREGSTSYNDGRQAICFMAHPSNTLLALIKLAVAATAPRVVVDVVSGRQRSMTAAELIPLLGDAAQEGRGSDPVLVERLCRLALEGRMVAFDDPIGVYIRGIEHTRLRRPDGSPVPKDWFVFGRGVGNEASADGRQRYQRLVVEVPPEEDFVVGDLVDVATGLPIRFGAQLAELVQLVVYLRVSRTRVVDVVLTRESLPSVERVRFDGCDKIREHHREFKASGPQIVQ